MAITFPVTIYPQKAIVTSGIATLHGVDGSGSEKQISGTNLFQAGNQTAVAGSKMKIEKLIEDGSFKMEDEASIWPTNTFTYAGISKTFDSTYSSGVGSPTTALFALANDNGADGDVVAMVMDSVARANGGVVFGGNAIARGDTGITAKYVGFEIDVVIPSTGAGSTGSGGLFINIFNKAITGAGIQLGALSGGTFANGIVIAGVATTGAGIAPGAAATMDSLFNTGNATFSTAAAIFSNTHKILLKGTASTHSQIYMDNTNNVRWTMGSGGFFIRNSADAANLYSFNASGILDMPSGGAYKISGTQVVSTRDTGWTAMTGSADKATAFATGSVTLAQLAGRVMSLQAALTTHGLIGA